MSQKELEWFQLSHSCSSKHLNDELSLSKSNGSDWTQLDMKTNDTYSETITIRSKYMLESLHFMIGQILKKYENT